MVAEGPLAGQAFTDDALPVSAAASGVHLWLVPTPVGNLGDLTYRAAEVLRQADAVACEDTRRTGALLTHLGIARPLVRLDAHTMSRAERTFGQYPRLAYVSDAGTPGISDPGSELVAAALRLGGQVEALPGATALIPALVLSGLNTARFTFEGFLPRTGRERKERLGAIAARSETSILYESPHRLHASLIELAAVCGEARLASVTRELSKKFEETRRGTLAELTEYFGGGVRGEIVVVVAGKAANELLPGEQLTDYPGLAAGWAAEGKDAREIRALLQTRGLRKNDAYQLALGAVQTHPSTNSPMEES
ncbi:16S rRNA (cytidine(1402)-2'-O)-methyltransferase [Deinococcus rubellus]